MVAVSPANRLTIQYSSSEFEYSIRDTEANPSQYLPASSSSPSSSKDSRKFKECYYEHVECSMNLIRALSISVS